MNILAIETSCDDTALAVIKASGQKNPNFKILANIISSQVELHKKWGGIYPTLAKREHQKNLPIVLKKVLNKAKSPKIDLIAVTIGPGLEPCLWTGINFAKDLAKKWNLPIVPVNHIEAHIFANFVGKSQISNLKSQIFPAICLVVSGGHTQLILMKDIGKYKILGETRDDAAGECFDKTARILGLGYPGGPAIAAKAKGRGQTPAFLPRPMIKQKNYDFSFSGLKTAVLYNYKKYKKALPARWRAEMAKEIQQAIIDVLIKKSIKAAKNYKAKTIILGGGVGANNELRKQLKKACLKRSFKHLLPHKKFCTDNAVMIAIAGYYHRKDVKSWKTIKADANLRIC